MAIEQSILRNIKKMLSVDPDDPSFDVDIVTQINSAFSHLHQLGVGSALGFQIEDETATWEDFLPAQEDETEILALRNLVKTNVFMHVRMGFDPPSLHFLALSMQRQLEESDWRVSVARETIGTLASGTDIVNIDGGEQPVPDLDERGPYDGP
jgi:hypothetical protein